MDCHWSSLKFFNEQPEDRFGDQRHAGAFLSKNYYPVQKPSVYGDVVVLTNEKTNGIHWQSMSPTTLSSRRAAIIIGNPGC